MKSSTDTSDIHMSEREGLWALHTGVVPVEGVQGVLLSLIDGDYDHDCGCPKTLCSSSAG